jgi:hypothetical protein
LFDRQFVGAGEQRDHFLGVGHHVDQIDDVAFARAVTEAIQRFLKLRIALQSKSHDVDPSAHAQVSRAHRLGDFKYGHAGPLQQPHESVARPVLAGRLGLSLQIFARHFEVVHDHPEVGLGVHTGMNHGPTPRRKSTLLFGTQFFCKHLSCQPPNEEITLSSDKSQYT